MANEFRHHRTLILKLISHRSKYLNLVTNFSSLIFNPFAEKLQLRNRENRQASELMIAGLLLIWQKKHPLDVSDMLTSYIEPKDRLKYFNDQD